MELELREINVLLSNHQKETIRDAFINSEEIRLTLKKDYIRGCDTLLVPTRYFKETDNENGIGAFVDEQTKKEMQDTMWEELVYLRDNDSSDKMVKDKTLEENRKRFNCFLRKVVDESEDKTKEIMKYMDLSDENLKNIIYDDNYNVWIYYGLFFIPAIDRDMKNEGITFYLNYSLLNDLAKDFVKDNIKKLLIR